MKMHFATCERHRAEQYFQNEGFNFLGDKAREFVLENLNPDLAKGFRVQDPSMHKPPQIMTESAEMHSKVLTLMTVKMVTDIIAEAEGGK